MTIRIPTGFLFPVKSSYSKVWYYLAHQDTTEVMNPAACCQSGLIYTAFSTTPGDWDGKLQLKMETINICWIKFNWMDCSLTGVFKGTTQFSHRMHEVNGVGCGW